MWQALHISIWQLSANLLPTSSRLKLCQVGWGQMHIFRFLQKYLIGFNPRLWLGHSRTFTELSISRAARYIACDSHAHLVGKDGLLNAAPFENRWWRFTANHRIRIRIRMSFIGQVCLYIRGICYSDKAPQCNRMTATGQDTDNKRTIYK